MPITVWRTARSGDDQSTTITDRLAYRLTAAYSRPGEAVVDLTDTHALNIACLRGRRPHHPAWFTGTSALAVGPRTPQHLHEPTEAPDSDSPDDVPSWFGDDLTDSDPLPGDDPPTMLGDGDDLQQQASLVVATWPLDADSDATNRIRLAWLLAACTRLLQPRRLPGPRRRRPGRHPRHPGGLHPVVEAAAGAGLGYLQHIVAVAADTEGDRFTYHATDEELLTLARATGTQQFVLHVKVHADLLVFTSRGGDRRA